MTRVWTPSRRLRTRAALVLVAGAGAAILTACEKPVPQVTFQSGARSVLVTPSNYCFDAARRASCKGAGGVYTLNAAAGSSINVSVPRTVADQAWIVSADVVDSTGKTQAIDGVGSNPIVDNHHARVPVPNIGVDNYLLTVTEFRGTTPTGVWQVQVNVTS